VPAAAHLWSGFASSWHCGCRLLKGLVTGAELIVEAIVVREIHTPERLVPDGIAFPVSTLTFSHKQLAGMFDMCLLLPFCRAHL